MLQLKGNTFLPEQTVYIETVSDGLASATDLQVFDSEDHWLRQVHFVGVFVDGGSDDGWVDDEGVIGIDRLTPQPHAGVLRGQVLAKVLVEDQRHADLT